VPDVPLSAPLAGWVELRWGDEPGATELGIAERMEALDRAVGLPPGGEQILLLGDRPAFRHERARVAGDASRSAQGLLAEIRRRG
jgi:hypothetical protein